MQQLVDNRYRLQQPLGSGGMADVFLAHDDVLDRDVALKVMSVRYSGDDEFVERFKREAQSAAALSHPNIVSIFDRGESDDGTYYIAMEYLSGGTLKDRILKRGALPPQTAAAVALQIAEALRAAHERDVIHRDIKPHNILITGSGDVKVTDFGIARAASSSTMTRTGHILGTAHYISPEQAMGEPVGPASDLYSLGVVLYEMLTGEMPFDADTPLGIAMKHVNGHLMPPQILNGAVPDGINAVTVRLLAKDPADRYGSDAELIEDLERVVAGLSPSGATTEMLTGIMPARTPRVGPPPPPRGVRPKGRRRRRTPLILALLALLILAPLAWAGYAFLGNAQEADRPDQRAAVPPQIAVPNLVGTTLDEARGSVGEDFELVEGSQTDGTEPAGTILEQDPPGGGELERDSEISVTVASGRNDVPNTMGDTRVEAERRLEEAGFEARVSRAESPRGDEGLVTGQDPAGGAFGDPVDLGAEVGITLGTGPDDVTVPALTGNTTAQAESILAGSNLELGSVGQDYSDTVPAGSVIFQDPPEGESLEPGSRVNVTESLGVQQVEIPEVYGATVEEAQAILDGAGILSEPVESTLANDEAAGTALDTDPTVGTLVEPGSTVTLYYSAGPPEPTVASPEPAPEPEQAPEPEPEPEPAPEPEPELVPEPDVSAEPDASAAPEDGNVPQNVQENVRDNENIPGNAGGNDGTRGGRGGNSDDNGNGRGGED